MAPGKRLPITLPLFRPPNLPSLINFGIRKPATRVMRGLEHVTQPQLIPVQLAMFLQPLSRHHDGDRALVDEVVGERTEQNAFDGAPSAAAEDDKGRVEKVDLWKTVNITLVVR